MKEELKNKNIINNIINFLTPILDKNSLVIFTAADFDINSYIDLIDNLTINQSKIVLSENLKNMILDNKADPLSERLISNTRELNSLMDKIDIIIVPVLTKNTLAKCAMGIQDNLATMAIAHGFMRNIPILAINEFFNPYSESSLKNNLNLNKFYNNMISGYQKRWVEFGAKIIGKDEFATELKNELYPELQKNSFIKSEYKKDKEDNKREAKGIITLEDVMKLNSNESMKISDKTLITPLAREYIDEKKIILERT